MATITRRRVIRGRKTAPKRRILRRRPHKMNSLMASSVRPDRLLVKLPYSDFYTVNMVAPSTGKTQVWNLNSIYDPDRTGVGHQPLGYDQWAGFYNKYRVFKVAYNISITNMGVDSAVMGGLTATNGSFGNFTSMEVFEQPHCRKFQVGNKEGSSTKTLKGVINLPYITGRPLVAYKSDNIYGANFGSNPLENLTLNLQLFALNQAAGTICQISTRIVYFVELYDPRPLPLSETNPLDPEDQIPTSITTGQIDEQNNP